MKRNPVLHISSRAGHSIGVSQLGVAEQTYPISLSQHQLCQIGHVCMTVDDGLSSAAGCHAMGFATVRINATPNDCTTARGMILA